jgi:hypothetical protein
MKRHVMKANERFALLLGALIVVGSAGPILADYMVDSYEPVVISDDIYNSSREVISLAGPNTNNGHGNNEDGVDSSNPGQGDGGPNGATDESCTGDTCVDDESAGGGAAPSKDKTK